MAHPPPDPFDVPVLGEPFGGGEQVTAPLVEQLTQAIQDLTNRLQTGMPGASAPSTGMPWWFHYKANYPDAPTQPPPGSAAARDAGWWGRYTDPGAEDFSYVRSYFRRKAVPRPPPVPDVSMASGITYAAAPAAARALATSGYPEWVLKVAAETGENAADIAAAFGIRGGARAAPGGVGGRPPKPPWWSAFTNAAPDPPGGGDPGRVPGPWWAKYFASAGNAVPPPPAPVSGMAAAMSRAAGTILGGSQWITNAMGLGGSGQPYSGAPWVTRAQTPWNRKRARHPWHWNTTRRVASLARLRFGRKGGHMAMAGMSAAAQRFAFSGNLASAARVGIMGAAAAGGPVAVGLVALAGGAVKAAEALQRMTAEQLIYNRELAKSSAQMAFVYAERDIQERFRQREMGDRLSASARALTRAEQYEKDQTKEMDTLWERFKNYAGAAWEVYKATFFQPIDTISLGVNKIAERGEDRDARERMLTLGEWAKQTQQRDEEARKRKDPKWEPPKNT